GDSNWYQHAATHVLNRRRHVVEHDVKLAAKQGGHGVGTAAVGYVEHVHTRHLFEELARQVDGAAVAGRGEGHFTRVCLGIVDKFLNGAVRTIGVGHQEIGHHGDASQGLKILDRVVG